MSLKNDEGVYSQLEMMYDSVNGDTTSTMSEDDMSNITTVPNKSRKPIKVTVDKLHCLNVHLSHEAYVHMQKAANIPFNDKFCVSVTKIGQTKLRIEPRSPVVSNIRIKSVMTNTYFRNLNASERKGIEFIKKFGHNRRFYFSGRWSEYGFGGTPTPGTAEITDYEFTEQGVVIDLPMKKFFEPKPETTISPPPLLDIIEEVTPLKGRAGVRSGEILTVFSGKGGTSKRDEPPTQENATEWASHRFDEIKSSFIDLMKDMETFKAECDDRGLKAEFSFGKDNIECEVTFDQSIRLT